MFGFGDAGGIAGFVMMAIWFFLFVAAVMAVFIPFWIYRIRNEIIETNELLGKLVKNTTGQGNREQ